MDTQVAIVGGGPAGIMAGVLLARQGIRVVVVEKHPDFLRDFRGDTIHPSTLQLLDELGWLTEFLRLPHTRMPQVTVQVGTEHVVFADFSRLPVPAPYVAFVPQWDFLDFLVDQARRYAGFTLLRASEVTGVRWVDGRAAGVRLGDGTEIRAELVIGADGRHSVVRAAAQLPSRRSAPPTDIMWFRLPRAPGQQVPFFRGGRGALVSIDRGDYWQIAYTTPPGTAADLHRAGLSAFRSRVSAIEPAFTEAVGHLGSWDDVHLLTVRVDRLTRWHRPGLLCIGDAAHAMSPAGGVGINLAIQDAVAAANLLGPVIGAGAGAAALDRATAAVQRRRMLPTRVTQLYQLRVLKGLYPRPGDDDTVGHLPLVFRLFRRFAVLRHLGGRFIGLGVRPEHIRSTGRLVRSHPTAEPGRGD